MIFTPSKNIQDYAPLMNGLYEDFGEAIFSAMLRWFGILPAYRNRKLGSRVLDWLKVEAAQNGAQSLYSYIDKNRRALPFYQRNGFQVLETVGQYMADNNLDPEDFEDPLDLVIQFELGEKPGK